MRKAHWRRVVGYSWILRECFPSGGSSEDRFVDTTRRLLHIRGGWPWTSGFCILRAWGMMERGGSVWPITSGLKGLSDFPPNIQTYNCSWKVHRNRTAEAFLDPQIAQIRHKLVLHAIPLHKNRKNLNSSRRQRHLSIWPQQWRRSGRNLKTYEIDSSEVTTNKTSNLEDLFNLFKTSRLSGEAQLEHM